MFEETIIAQSTAHGMAIRGMIRINGPAAIMSLRGLFEPELCAEPKPFVKTGNLIFWGVTRPVPAKVFYWSEGHGYTGHQSVEIHTLGSQPILDALITAVTKSGVVRHAEPGELTLRAFLSGRLDLTQAEAVLGVIEAPSQNALKIALQQLAGGMTLPIKKIRETLFELLTHLEAGLDFPEEDIEFISRLEISSVLTSVYEQMELLQQRMVRRGCLNESPRVTLLGLPNAGKSTLFNLLLQTDRAIVSPTPGTTRDYLEAGISFDGLPCTFVDTAGISTVSQKDTADESAQQLSKQISGQSDLIIYCFENNPKESVNQQELVNQFGFDETKILFVETKSDLNKLNNTERNNTELTDTELNNTLLSKTDVTVSSKTGEGIDLLRAMIAQRLREMLPDNILRSTALRCRESVNKAVRLLEQALEMCDSQNSFFDESILASQIRSVLETLGLIDGSVYTDKILDEIFSRFCIGK
ncbi:MAG: tRNA uridine-5-carboxymethylaminomethyl(34) synthesis GTPase MnmE [Planctomycetaceae bacterium]|jgi:tRNA modification GTPase|nr:tRNA uridine-5-carboxymethylaminomethyl(34) synthesis GTPase MnmE [Planctomycetaceae bacterium]